MRTLTKLKAAVLEHDHRISVPVSVSALAMRAAVYVIEDCMRRLDVTLRGPNAQDCAQAMFCGRFRTVSDVSEFVRGRTQLITAAALMTGGTGVAQQMIRELGSDGDFSHFLHEGIKRNGWPSTGAACTHMLTVLTLDLDVRGKESETPAPAIAAPVKRHSAPLEGSSDDAGV